MLGDMADVGKEDRPTLGRQTTTRRKLPIPNP